MVVKMMLSMGPMLGSHIHKCKWGRAMEFWVATTVVAWGWNDHGQCNDPEPNADFIAIEVARGTGLAIRSDILVGVEDYYTEDDPGEANPDDGVPSVGVRLAAHPNPFNPQTTITFTLQRDEWAVVCVYELTGRQVAVLADGLLSAGAHSLTWNGLHGQGHIMPSGTYVVRLQTDSGVEARKVMLVR